MTPPKPTRRLYIIFVDDKDRCITFDVADAETAWSMACFGSILEPRSGHQSYELFVSRCYDFTQVVAYMKYISQEKP